MTRITMDPGWEAHALDATDQLFRDRLGPAIEADARRLAPMRTGRLRDSISHALVGHHLIVEAAAPYSADVELGHRIAHGPHMREVGPQVKGPHPFLRPAAFTERHG